MKIISTTNRIYSNMGLKIKIINSWQFLRLKSRARHRICSPCKSIVDNFFNIVNNIYCTLLKGLYLKQCSFSDFFDEHSVRRVGRFLCQFEPNNLKYAVNERLDVVKKYEKNKEKIIYRPCIVVLFTTIDIFINSLGQMSRISFLNIKLANFDIFLQKKI